MNTRENTIQKFSTFLSFDDKNSNKKLFWQTDPKLERRMKSIIQSNIDTHPDSWARYFLQIAREIAPIQDITIRQDTSQIPFSSAMAGKHLSAYLQEACLWTAQTLYKKLMFLRHKYSIEEFFQMSNIVANPPIKILKSFNFEYTYTNVESYARTAISRAVKNQIYQQDVEAKRIKFSDYGLLKDLSNKELKECLASAAIKQEQINLYCIVCQCFDEIYQPSDNSSARGLEKPNQSQLQEMALYYNQRCHQLNLNTQAATAEDIQEMLRTCIKLAREYRSKRFVPLEDKYDNLIDFKVNILDNAIEQEERNEVDLLVSNLFTRLSKTGQIMFMLWLGLNLTQTEMASVLKNKYPELQKQYQIARQLGKSSKHLLSDFIQEWNQANPENLISNAKNIELIKESLINCLQLHCQKTLSKILKQLKNQLIDKKAYKFRESLQLAFQHELESMMHLDNNSLDIVKNKLFDFIDNLHTSTN